MRDSKGPITSPALKKMMKKFEAAGSLASRQRSGRPSTAAAVAPTVEQTVQSCRRLLLSVNHRREIISTEEHPFNNNSSEKRLQKEKQNPCKVTRVLLPLKEKIFEYSRSKILRNFSIESCFLCEGSTDGVIDIKRYEQRLSAKIFHFQECYATRGGRNRYYHLGRGGSRKFMIPFKAKAGRSIRLRTQPIVIKENKNEENHLLHFKRSWQLNKLKASTVIYLI
ncbi:hypothetical protein CEXT_412621 [Caerostris extrusa]|uniref:DUF4817 domain-containing protein n=1 Tax=Caerostris extrusa TaxID=172846 RepID=A0AAV4NYK6_CAEEX|nr:hypothetical protein CEXT_412621 [Caerostris extrusa]